MELNRKIQVFERVLSLMPRGLCRELSSIASGSLDFYGSLREIRLRSRGRSTVIVGTRELPLCCRISEETVGEMLSRMTEESLYAYRESLRDGYISLGDGVRVGVCGTARTEGGEMAGVANVTSLVFRFPFATCSFANRLYSEYLATGGGNLLVCSPPSGGKTTALRALGALFSRGQGGVRVAVIDGRGEFIPSDYYGCTVDILRGYRREDGVRIALRNLSAEAVVLDEIVTEGDVRAVLDCFGTGLRIIASAHADSPSSLYSREVLMPLFERGVFERVVFILEEDGRHTYRLEQARRVRELCV